MLGKTIADYQILEKLDVGGMGVVCKPATPTWTALSPSKYCRQRRSLTLSASADSFKRPKPPQRWTIPTSLPFTISPARTALTSLSWSTCRARHSMLWCRARDYGWMRSSCLRGF